MLVILRISSAATSVKWCVSLDAISCVHLHPATPLLMSIFPPIEASRPELRTVLTPTACRGQPLGRPPHSSMMASTRSTPGCGASMGSGGWLAATTTPASAMYWATGATAPNRKARMLPAKGARSTSVPGMMIVMLHQCMFGGCETKSINDHDPESKVTVCLALVCVVSGRRDWCSPNLCMCACCL